MTSTAESIAFNAESVKPLLFKSFSYLSTVSCKSDLSFKKATINTVALYMASRANYKERKRERERERERDSD